MGKVRIWETGVSIKLPHETFKKTSATINSLKFTQIYVGKYLNVILKILKGFGCKYLLTAGIFTENNVNFHFNTFS